MLTSPVDSGSGSGLNPISSDSGSNHDLSTTNLAKRSVWTQRIGLHRGSLFPGRGSGLSVYQSGLATSGKVRMAYAHPGITVPQPLLLNYFTRARSVPLQRPLGTRYASGQTKSSFGTQYQKRNHKCDRNPSGTPRLAYEFSTESRGQSLRNSN